MVGVLTVASTPGGARTQLTLPRVGVRSGAAILVAERRRRGAAVGLVDGVHQFCFRHLRPAPDLEPLGDIQQMGFAGEGVDAPCGLGRAVPCGSTALGVLCVTRTLGVLGLPVIADLLERVLQGRERDAVCRLAVAVVFSADSKVWM